MKEKMVVFIFSLVFLTSSFAFSSEYVCSNEYGSFNVVVSEKPTIYDESYDESYDDCRKNLFTQEVSDEIYNKKLEILELYTSDKDVLDKYSKLWGEQLERAVGGTAVECKVEHNDLFGFIVNGEKSFVISTTSNMYYEMIDVVCVAK